MDNFKSHFYDYGRWPLPGLAQARVATEYGWTFSSARRCHAPLELPPPCLCLAFGTMSNVGKFLFDLCNEFSINILLLKLAADSCAPSPPSLISLSHTHTDIYCHTCCSSIYFYGNAFSLQVDFALVLGLGHVQMRFTVVCLPCCCCCSAAVASWQGRNPGSSFRQMADRKCTFPIAKGSSCNGNGNCDAILWRL